MSGRKREITPQFLSRVQMLANLPEEALERLGGYFKRVELASGETLFKQGEKGESLYIVNSGCIDILIHNDEGGTIKVAALKSGECFGELSALDYQPRSASAVASDRSVLLELSRERFMELMGMYPLIAQNLLLLLCGRIRASDIRLISFEWLANVDKLTGLYNRRWFDAMLEQEFMRSQRYNHPLSLLILDIDHFKHLNDSYGHLAGDRVLQQISNVMREGIRSTDLPARHGGEEFVVILPETQIKEAAIVAERIRWLVESRAFVDMRGKRIGRVTVSIGVGEREGFHRPADLVDHVDQSLYLAKRSGRNCVKSLNG